MLASNPQIPLEDRGNSRQVFQTLSEPKFVRQSNSRVSLSFIHEIRRNLTLSGLLTAYLARCRDWRSEGGTRQHGACRGTTPAACARVPCRMGKIAWGRGGGWGRRHPNKTVPKNHSPGRMSATAPEQDGRRASEASRVYTRIHSYIDGYERNGPENMRVARPTAGGQRRPAGCPIRCRARSDFARLLTGRPLDGPVVGMRDLVDIGG